MYWYIEKGNNVITFLKMNLVVQTFQISEGQKQSSEKRFFLFVASYDLFVSSL